MSCKLDLCSCIMVIKSFHAIFHVVEHIHLDNVTTLLTTIVLWITFWVKYKGNPLRNMRQGKVNGSKNYRVYCHTESLLYWTRFQSEPSFSKIKRVVTKIQNAGVLLPLPSASYAISHSLGGLILGLTGVGDFPRSERSNPAHFSASAKNGSFANTSDILCGNPSSKSYDQYQAHVLTRGLGNRIPFQNWRDIGT